MISFGVDDPSVFMSCDLHSEMMLEIQVWVYLFSLCLLAYFQSIKLFINIILMTA
jgi:hypothetical protein